ncbi:hypothetical protein FGO68_gene11006 [Halteria grandinella]|uniref:Uncharacterized protein n=1 Tax=Halteria grandinella TaxID=5974 RepID=A0A8J8P346_HALGN|nr:hypothetical protein FGO68_gene11006 [Halteria grandinella]
MADHFIIMKQLATKSSFTFPSQPPSGSTSASSTSNNANPIAQPMGHIPVGASHGGSTTHHHLLTLQLRSRILFDNKTYSQTKENEINLTSSQPQVVFPNQLTEHLKIPTIQRTQEQLTQQAGKDRNMKNSLRGQQPASTKKSRNPYPQQAGTVSNRGDMIVGNAIVNNQMSEAKRRSLIQIRNPTEAQISTRVPDVQQISTRDNNTLGLNNPQGDFNKGSFSLLPHLSNRNSPTSNSPVNAALNLMLVKKQKYAIDQNSNSSFFGGPITSRSRHLQNEVTSSQPTGGVFGSPFPAHIELMHGPFYQHIVQKSVGKQEIIDDSVPLVNPDLQQSIRKAFRLPSIVIGNHQQQVQQEGENSSRHQRQGAGFSIKSNIARVITDIVRPAFGVGAGLTPSNGENYETTLLKELTSSDKKTSSKNVSPIRGGASPYRRAQGIGALLQGQSQLKNSGSPALTLDEKSPVIISKLRHQISRSSIQNRLSTDSQNNPIRLPFNNQTILKFESTAGDERPDIEIIIDPPEKENDVKNVSLRQSQFYLDAMKRSRRHLIIQDTVRTHETIIQDESQGLQRSESVLDVKITQNEENGQSTLSPQINDPEVDLGLSLTIPSHGSSIIQNELPKPEEVRQMDKLETLLFSRPRRVPNQLSDYMKMKHTRPSLTIIMFDGVIGYGELTKVTQIDGTVVGFEDKIWTRKDACKYIGRLTEMTTVCIVLPSNLKSAIVSIIVSQSFQPDVARRLHFYQILPTTKKLLYPSMISVDDLILDLHKRLRLPFDIEPIIAGSYLQEFDSFDEEDSRTHQIQMFTGLSVRSDRCTSNPFTPKYVMVQHVRIDSEGCSSNRPKGFGFQLVFKAIVQQIEPKYLSASMDMGSREKDLGVNQSYEAPLTSAKKPSGILEIQIRKKKPTGIVTKLVSGHFLDHFASHMTTPRKDTPRNQSTTSLNLSVNMGSVHNEGITSHRLQTSISLQVPNPFQKDLILVKLGHLSDDMQAIRDYLTQQIAQNCDNNSFKHYQAPNFVNSNDHGQYQVLKNGNNQIITYIGQYKKDRTHQTKKSQRKLYKQQKMAQMLDLIISYYLPQLQEGEVPSFKVQALQPPQSSQIEGLQLIKSIPAAPNTLERIKALNLQ